jgi:hypothetical protein
MPIALCLLVLFFASPQLRAQENQPRWFLGVVGGYNSNIKAGWLETIGQHGEILDYDGGGSNLNGMLLGLSGEYWLTDNGSLTLQVKFYYEQKPSGFEIAGVPFGYFDTTNSRVEPYYQFPYPAYQTTYNLINVESLVKFNIVSRLGISIGPKLGYVITKKYSESGIAYYYAPSSNVTPPYLPDTLNSSGNIPGAHSFRLGLQIGLQYDFLLGNFLITPEVSYDIGETTIAGSWYVNTLAGTVDVKYGL